MKLIIDIDDVTYEDIKKGKIYSSYRDVPQESVVAIANGTPLEDHCNKLAQAQWIPVSEGLPETDDEVLVTSDNGDIYLGFIYKNGSREWYIRGDSEYHEPIAWMPLPEPYTAQEGESE